MFRRKVAYWQPRPFPIYIIILSHIIINIRIFAKQRKFFSITNFQFLPVPGYYHNFFDQLIWPFLIVSTSLIFVSCPMVWGGSGSGSGNGSWRSSSNRRTLSETNRMQIFWETKKMNEDGWKFTLEDLYRNILKLLYNERMKWGEWEGGEWNPIIPYIYWSLDYFV